jgi:plastocyanin
MALGVIVVATAVSTAGFFATRQTVSEAEAAGATTIEMVNFEFDPGTVSMRLPGIAVVHNSDPFVHDISIEPLGIAETVGPGGTILVDFGGAKPGTYDFFCTLHSSGGDGMKGIITIGG